MSLPKTEDRIPVYEEKIKVLNKRIEDRERLLAGANALVEKRRTLVEETKADLADVQDKLARAIVCVEARQKKAAAQQSATQKRTRQARVQKQQTELFGLMNVLQDSGKSVEEVLTLLQSVETEA